MDQRFADWYRLVDSDPRSEMLTNRSEVVEAQAETATGARVLDLVRLFTGLPQNQVATATEVVTAFKDADAAFPMRGNDLLVQVLAGAVLVAVMSRPGRIGDVAALAIRSAHFHGAGHDGPFPDALETADTYLAERARDERYNDGAVEESPLTDMVSSLTVPKLKALTQVSGQYDWNSVNPSLESIKEYASGLTAAVSALRRMLLAVAEEADQRIERIASGATNRTRAYEEEHNVLWWLFSEYSRDLSKPVEEIGLAGYAVVSGKELADLTTILPGILAADGMLHRALRATRDSSAQALALTAAVDATPAEWRKSISASNVVATLRELAPVHLAISKSVESPGRWGAGFRSAARFKKDPRLKPVEIAEQVYTECMLARAVGALSP